jgi:tetratricopeptide (TPR) repeat protein
VLRLQDYRSRREKRYEQALALYSADRERALLLGYLWSSLSVASADRAAVVWVDEYGPGLAHGHVILDVVADRPRRAFPLEPLQEAWADGVPGLYDVCAREHAPGMVDHAYHSVCVVALGSDGLRAWFLVADGQSPRPRLSAQARSEIMFLAGECSAVLMHRDMPSPEDTVLVPEGGRERFAAWPILKDIEGYEKDEEVNRRISCRFLVARVVRAILDDDLATDREALEHQISCVHREIGKQFVQDSERALWEAVLDASARDDRVAFAESLLSLGIQVEKLGHLSGAREFYRSAYEAAMAVGSEKEALDAARYAGRAWRRGSEWDRALAWYQVARSLAATAGDRAKEAVVLDGVANVHKEKGNLPRARQVLDEALVLALESGDRYAIGSTYHDLMAVASMSGRPDEAIRMGWKAVQLYESEQDRLNALTSMAASLLEAGELDAAESAYAVVARRVESVVYRLYALSGYAKVAGLRGDRGEFERRLKVLESSGVADGPPALRAGDWLGRGEAYEAIDDYEEARRSYRKALELATGYQLGQFLFQAEEALQALDRRVTIRASEIELPAAYSLEGIEEIREELDRMRRLSPVLAGV